jgi:broad specificity phosphatase PhoE
VRLFVFARHGQSLLNVQGRVNGDPARDPGLSERGVSEAQALAERIAGLDVDVAVVSPFPRTLETARVALEGRGVPLEVDDDLGDIRLGEIDGEPLAAYRAEPAHEQRDVCFPGGESLNEAAGRYAAAFERLLGRSERTTLVVTHEIPIRYALNSLRGSDSLDRPVHDVANASPYLFYDEALARATARIRELAGHT